MAIEGLRRFFNIAVFSSLMINRAISDRIALEPQLSFSFLLFTPKTGKSHLAFGLSNYQSEVFDTLSIEARSQVSDHVKLLGLNGILNLQQIITATAIHGSSLHERSGTKDTVKFKTYKRVFEERQLTHQSPGHLCILPAYTCIPVEVLLSQDLANETKQYKGCRLRRVDGNSSHASDISQMSAINCELY